MEKLTHNRRILPLTGEDAALLDRQRKIIEMFLSADSLKQYETPGGKLNLLNAILKKNLFRRNQSYELQCLGVVLGDAFASQLSMKWVIVKDQVGRDPALCVPGSTIVIFPLTMISKRIERSEAVDIFDLFDGVAELVKEKAAELNNHD